MWGACPGSEVYGQSGHEGQDIPAQAGSLDRERGMPSPACRLPKPSSYDPSILSTNSRYLCGKIGVDRPPWSSPIRRIMCRSMAMSGGSARSCCSAGASNRLPLIARIYRRSRHRGNFLTRSFPMQVGHAICGRPAVQTSAIGM
jgi:hypothetical protein